MPSIVEIIKTEFDRNFEETQANTLRAAAWFVFEDHPNTTSGDFADAAESLGIHRGTARNRWNEAMRDLEIAEGIVRD